MVWGLAEVYATQVATAWLRLAAIRTRCDADVLWPGVFALVGVLLGCGFTLLVASVTERWRTRRQFQRYMLDRRYTLYQQTLAAIDDLLYMRDDHADFGHAARTLTAAIVDLELWRVSDARRLLDVRGGGRAGHQQDPSRHLLEGQFPQPERHPMITVSDHD